MTEAEIREVWNSLPAPKHPYTEARVFACAISAFEHNNKIVNSRAVAVMKLIWPQNPVLVGVPNEIEGTSKSKKQIPLRQADFKRLMQEIHRYVGQETSPPPSPDQNGSSTPQVPTSGPASQVGTGIGDPVENKQVETPAIQTAVAGTLPEEVENSPALFEGAKRQITVNAYERNPVARQKCIAAYGTACWVCEFNFGAEYGPDAEGYIHVHHLKPLSEVGGEYEVDPVEDLRPVCPNCHAVLHLGGGCRSVEEVQKMLAQQKARPTKHNT